MRRVNLIPEDILKARRFSKKRYATIFGGVALTFILFLFFQKTEITKLQLRNRELRQNIELLKGRRLEADLKMKEIDKKKTKLEEEKKATSQRLTLLAESGRKDIVYSRVLADLGQLLPVALRATKVSLETDSLLMRGLALDSETVSRFMKRLDESKLFRSTTFQYIQKAASAETESVDFEIKTQLRTGVPKTVRGKEK